MSGFRRLSIGLVTLVTSLGAGVSAALASLCPAELAARLDAELTKTPLERSYVGMVLQTQGATEGARQTLYARHGNHFFHSGFWGQAINDSGGTPPFGVKTIAFPRRYMVALAPAAPTI